MYPKRKKILTELEKEFSFKSILYVTGDRPSSSISMQAQIMDDVLPLFLEHLDHLGKVDHLGLILYSRGGGIIAGWSIVNLIRQFCNKLTIIVPFRAQSTATLMCLGADVIIMTKQATLGPIDPSTNGVFNPIPPGQSQPVSLSVENLAAFLEMAKELQLDPSGMTQIMLKLSDSVNPLAIGNANRVRGQIRNLANKLLMMNTCINESERQTIINELCENSGSHDYTIYRREAIKLGLNIQKPNDNQYKLIKSIYDDFESELKLRTPFTLPQPGPGKKVTVKVCKALLESPSYKSHTFKGEYSIEEAPGPPPGGSQLTVNPIFEGWR